MSGNPGRMGPFGFTFTQLGQLLTTENAGGTPLMGGAASYEVPDDSVLVPISEVGNGRSDTCGIVNTDDGKYAFTTNFQSGDISSFRVERDGRLVLLNPVAATIGNGAADEALSGNSHYLYARQVGDPSLQGMLHVFRVEHDGSLTPLQVVADGSKSFQGIGIAAK